MHWVQMTSSIPLNQKLLHLIAAYYPCKRAYPLVAMSALKKLARSYLSKPMKLHKSRLKLAFFIRVLSQVAAVQTIQRLWIRNKNTVKYYYALINQPQTRLSPFSPNTGVITTLLSSIYPRIPLKSRSIE